MAAHQYKPYPALLQDSPLIQAEWIFTDSANNRLSCDNNYFSYESGIEFDCEKGGLHIICNICIENISSFFGPGPQGILPHSGRLGASIRWFSQTSHQQRTGNCIHFHRQSDGRGIISDFIEANTLRGQVAFDLILFFAGGHSNPVGTNSHDTLAEMRDLPDDEKIFASIPGSILYQSKDFGVRLDGKGSVFPIFYTHEPQRPLWWLELDIVDPREQTVDSAISLYINRAHVDYALLCDKSATEQAWDTAVHKQIFASAMVQLLVKLRSNGDWWDTIINSDCTGNSVCSLARYGYRFLWDGIDPADAPQTLHEKLLEIIDRKLATREKRL